MMNVQARVFGVQGVLRATSLRATVIDAEVARQVQHWGMLLNTLIKAKASGRPGPNAPTGDYRRSWTHQFYQVGPEATSVNGTNAPQGRRLEYGFVGADSLGRVYNQAPLPHVGPAKDEIEPRWVDSMQRWLRTI